MTSIVGYTEMLQDGSIVGALTPSQLPLLETIARNGQRLIVICNDLLMLSGLDSGAAQWEREALDLTTILKPVEEAVRPLLDRPRPDPARRPAPTYPSSCSATGPSSSASC